MKQYEKLRALYVQYLKSNPKSYKGLKESCEFLGISEASFK